MDEWPNWQKFNLLSTAAVCITLVNWLIEIGNWTFVCSVSMQQNSSNDEIAKRLGFHFNTFKKPVCEF